MIVDVSEVNAVNLPDCCVAFVVCEILILPHRWHPIEIEFHERSSSVHTVCRTMTHPRCSLNI